MRTNRRMATFSPILPTSARRCSSNVPPLAVRPDKAPTSAGSCNVASSAPARANARNSSFLATKSVSQFTSISVPVLPSGAICAATTPSAVTREAALLARLPSLTRRISSALPWSPFASASAFLHSIIGASVFSRSSFTMPAAISALPGHQPLSPLVKKKGLAPQHVVNPDATSHILAFLDLDELVAATHDLLHAVLPALEHRVRYATRIETDRSARVVVARNHIIHAVRGMVRVDYADQRDTELPRLRHRAFLVAHVDHEHCVGQPVHVLDAAKAAIELDDFPLIVQRFLLRQLVERAVAHHGFHVLQA